MAIWLVMLKDKVVEKFVLADGQKIVIGRGHSADVVVDNPSVSRKHLSFACMGNRYQVTDLGSRNGTYVNGEKISGTVAVSPSDIVQIGKFILSTSRDAGEVAPFAMLRDGLDSGEGTAGRLDDLMEQTAYAEVNPVAKGPFRQLTLLKGKASPKCLALEGKNEFVIGKDESCDLRVGGWFTGKVNCALVVSGKFYYLQAAPGSAPPAVNGRKVSGRERLGLGDIISVGGAELKFESGQ